MNDTIVFISPDFDSVYFEKIAESLRKQQIQITDDANIATFIIKPLKQSSNCAIIKICPVPQNISKQTALEMQEIQKLYEQFIQTYKIPKRPDFPNIQWLDPEPILEIEQFEPKQKVKKFMSQRDLKRYNQTKQNINQKLFLTRTTHK